MIDDFTAGSEWGAGVFAISIILFQISSKVFCPILISQILLNFRVLVE